MVRELDQSRITLRLIEQADREGKGTDEHVIAKLTGPTLATLQRALVSVDLMLYNASQSLLTELVVPTHCAYS